MSWEERDLTLQASSLDMEFVLTVVESGEAATCSAGEALEAWDRIVAEQALACRKDTCEQCVAGDFHKCPEMKLYGQGRDGGFAEFVRLSSRSVFHRVPNDIPSHVAALIEPLSIAVHAVDRAMDAIERMHAKHQTVRQQSLWEDVGRLDSALLPLSGIGSHQATSKRAHRWHRHIPGQAT